MRHNLSPAWSFLRNQKRPEAASLSVDSIFLFCVPDDLPGQFKLIFVRANECEGQKSVHPGGQMETQRQRLRPRHPEIIHHNTAAGGDGQYTPTHTVRNTANYELI